MSRVSELNDALRRSFSGGRVVMTAGVNGLDEEARAAVLAKVKSFDIFTPDNDPHQEHDFGSFSHGGEKFFWKIDAYNLDMTGGSENPADPDVTTRVLTIMLAAEY